ncbi:MAG TPA: tRNA (N(6)-L-threonylcarbamoyladenosine(37)-C(2))-methylthiotransferase MtaB [Anaerolineae bacterium]|nr:tRNA (N(6)-L-threonylcarbamoyladenosine(37)-C(2))-methylthiotransferase MtaB [Anaerolineae bacterium]HQH38502.1 tRNA (N(6)-L-threonylcarbamoyladenosine(37)-C(2))-methylthiotransferase MtaB [Anaerolineae bacterium]
MQIYLESLGCRLNAAEIEAMARLFAGAGHDVVEAPEGADIIVLNSCTVTAQAARKSRHRLHTLHHRYPQARLAVSGCWATEDVAQASRLPGVAWVIPNEDKARAVEIITGVVAEPAPWSPGRWGHTRAFLAVQDGCDHACTYCVTRLLRGPARSRPLADAVQAARDLAVQGAQEVVLTGVSLGAYGHEVGLEHGLATLVAAILRETDVPRLRLSSVEPWDVDESLIALWDNPRFCRQLHIPLQSGCDVVLQRMGRRYTVARFAALVDAVRAVSPAIAITTDVIVGFPGESEADFAASLDFVARMAFARLHVFPYSVRPGTPAIRLPEAVPQATRTERAARMRALGEQLATEYRLGFIGQTLPVLWEQRDAAGYWHGLTDNYLEVVVPAEEDLYNRIMSTHLISLEDDVLSGELMRIG